MTAPCSHEQPTACGCADPSKLGHYTGCRWHWEEQPGWDPLREKLAAIEHERWAAWQAWMHNQLQTDKLRDGTWVRYLPGELLVRWERQIATPYAELMDEEQESDREQVDRYWPLIEPLLRSAEEIAAYEEIVSYFGPRHAKREHNHLEGVEPMDCELCRAQMAYARLEEILKREREARNRG